MPEVSGPNGATTLSPLRWQPLS